MIDGMRRPIELKAWLKPRALRAWVDDSDTPAHQRRRLAVWMASLGRYTAGEIAEVIGVTEDAVGRWLRQYNESGPEHFDGPGRGGRRHARLELAEESRLLDELAPTARQGYLLTGPQIQAMLQERTGEVWPLKTVYDLLHRHDWRRVQPRPRHVRADPEAQQRYKKSSATSSRTKSRRRAGSVSVSFSRTRPASG